MDNQVRIENKLHKVGQRTIVFGMDENIGKCLDEVGKIIPEKLGTENDIFSGECRTEGTAE